MNDAYLQRQFRDLITRDHVQTDKVLLAVLACVEPTTRLYIRHEDLQTPANGWALFGPFTEMEIEERLNGPYAEALAGSGNVDAVEYTDEEVAIFCVNSRDWWLEREEEFA